MRVIVSGMINPASEMPDEPRAIAHPRCSTNHFESVAFTTRGPTIEKAAPPAIIESATNCHSSSTRDMARNATA